MSKFLDAAFQILREAAVPLTAAEITGRALERGLIPSTGQTPSQTMKSKLSTAILREQGHSRFMRSAAGKFALREDAFALDEFVAPKYAKALLHEDAVVFPAASLRTYAPSPGLWPITSELGGRLLQECRPMERSLAEADPSVIQLVSGFVVQYRDQVLTYKRTKRLPEARLHGEYSVLFGGHLNPEDVWSLFSIFEPDGVHLMYRELNEELRLPDSSHRIDLRGILYDDTREVSRQHLALVYDVQLTSPRYSVGERGFLMQDKFESWSDVGARLGEFENWSQLLYSIYGEGVRVDHHRGS